MVIFKFIKYIPLIFNKIIKSYYFLKKAPLADFETISLLIHYIIFSPLYLGIHLLLLIINLYDRKI